MASFFIDRPIFAWVIAIIIMIGGGLSIGRLPVSQYPAVAPPTFTVGATYPGASAATLEQTVTQVIEQRMNGLDGLRYLSSSSDSTGGGMARCPRGSMPVKPKVGRGGYERSTRSCRCS